MNNEELVFVDDNMTNEEAKAWLEELYARAVITDEYGDMENMQPYEEAVNLAIKLLEQKTGHWIFKDANDQMCSIYTCDKCGEQITIFDDMLTPQECHYYYCPNCGRRMIASQESEE